jgi:hypothetical protein
MTQEDIIRMAREAGLASIYSACDEPGVRYAYEDWDEELERFAALVAAAERKEWPNLDPVITWLENGCDPKEAAKELRIYAAAIRARGNK